MEVQGVDPWTKTSSKNNLCVLMAFAVNQNSHVRIRVDPWTNISVKSLQQEQKIRDIPIFGGLDTKSPKKTNVPYLHGDKKANSI